MSEPDRRSGRRTGRTHNAEGAREAILNAAEQVFAQHGFDGARVDAIAQAAGYNKSLIFQYFGDKLGLYAEVIRRADDQTRVLQTEVLAALSAGDMTRPETLARLLREFVGWYFDYLVAHPQILRIYNWEMAEGWQTFSKIISQRDYDDIEQFGAVLTKLQTAGLLRTKLDPIVQMVAGVFVSHGLLGILPVFRYMMPSVDLSTPDGLAALREFIVELVTNGLLRVPEPAGTPATT